MTAVIKSDVRLRSIKINVTKIQIGKKDDKDLLYPTGVSFSGREIFHSSLKNLSCTFKFLHHCIIFIA